VTVQSELRQQATERASALAFVGRQPIYDRRLQVIGYELLFRPHAAAATAGELQPEQATAQILLNTFLEIGIEAVVGPCKAFVNFSRSLLLSDYPRVLPPRQVVLEVLESVTVDDDLRTAIQALRQAGYQIALDDFTDQLHLRPLVRLAHIIKVDLRGCSGTHLINRLAGLRKGNLKLLAEKVETQSEFRYCIELGFDYFQGYFLRRPEVVHGRRVPTLPASAVRLMQRLCDPDVELFELEDPIQNDVSLSYKLLRLANSALLPAQNTVASIRQALQLVGLKTITVWTGLLLLAGLSDKPHDVVNAAVLRANMCQLLAAPVAPRWANTGFLVGLFSVLDVLLDRPMAEVVGTLSLVPEVEHALVARQGILGDTLQIVIDYEQGRWEHLADRVFDRATIVKAYLDALAVTEEITRILGSHG
jgi:EAL and modified HD-GYP domain-containing signal transduction protein